MCTEYSSVQQCTHSLLQIPESGHVLTRLSPPSLTVLRIRLGKSRALVILGEKLGNMETEKVNNLIGREEIIFIMMNE